MTKIHFTQLNALVYYMLIMFRVSYDCRLCEVFVQNRVIFRGKQERELS